MCNNFGVEEKTQRIFHNYKLWDKMRVPIKTINNKPKRSRIIQNQFNTRILYAEYKVTIKKS